MTARAAAGTVSAIPRTTPQTVVVLGAGLLAEADRELLHEAALDGAHEIGVRLHAVDQDDAVGLPGEAVEEEGDALDLAQRDDLHGGADRRPDGRLGDAEVREHLGLAGGGGAAVRAHGRHDEGLEAGGREPRDEAADQHGDVGDAAAADSYGDAGARRERGERRLRARPLGLERREHVDGRQDVEVLSHFEHGRQVRLVSGDRPHHERIRHPDLQTRYGGLAYREAPAAFAAGRPARRAAHRRGRPRAASRGIIPRRHTRAPIV